MPNFFNNKNIKPMLLTEQKNPFDNPQYLFEIKFDGMRAIIYVSNNEIVIKSRNGKILNDLFPELLEIKKLVKEKCIFDGEIVILENGFPDFSKLQNRIVLKNSNKILVSSQNNPATFIAFDILYKNNSLVDNELIKRKKILATFKDTNCFVKSPYILEKGKKLYKLTKKFNLEGIIAKKIDSVYQAGKRSEDWIKIKHVLDNEFYIGAYKEEENKFVANLVIGEMQNDKLKYVGKVTIGKNKKDFIRIKEIKKEINSFEDFNDPNYTFVKPTLCTIKYLTKTKNGKLRHPVFKTLIID